MGKSYSQLILGDPGAECGDEGKSKWAGKYGTKKSKGRIEEPLGTMSYQTSSKRSPPFWLLIGARKTQVFFPSWKTLLSFGGNVSFLGRKLHPGKKGTSQGGALRKSVSVTALANQFEGKLTHSL